MKKNTRIPNKVIVLGGNHHNELGIIRSLGEVGCRVFFIALNVKKSFVVKSRYIEKYWLVNNEDDLLKTLLNSFKNSKYNPIIIPSNDKSAAIIDENVNILNDKFIFPSIEQQKGAILQQMNKKIMNDLATKHGFIVPKGCVIQLSKINTVEIILEKHHIKYPCIIKPLQSVDGQKSDILVNKNRKELISNLKKLKKYYVEVYVQEFIQKEGEIGIQGLAMKNGKEVIIPGIVNKIRDSSVSPGSTTYANISKSNNLTFKKTIFNVRSLIKEIRFEGIFDLELMHSEENLYFIEVNFRNGAYGYAYTYAGVNLPLLWCLQALGRDLSKESTKITKEITLMNEIADFKNVSMKKVSFIKWFKQFLKTDVYLLFNKKDIKPFIYKFLYR